MSSVARRLDFAVLDRPRLPVWPLVASVLVVALIGVVVSVTGWREVTSGDGWHQLARTNVGPERAEPEPNGEVAGTADAARAMWARYADGRAGSLGFDARTQVLLRVTTYGSVFCPTHLTAADVGRGGVRVRVGMGFHQACDAALGPWTYLMAVARDRVPAVPFQVVVSGTDTGEFTITSIE